jgi:hypothetical protein
MKIQAQNKPFEPGKQNPNREGGQGGQQGGQGQKQRQGGEKPGKEQEKYPRE